MTESVKLTVEDKERLIAFAEHVLTIGHGEVIMKAANHKVVCINESAQWELRNGEKK